MTLEEVKRAIEVVTSKLDPNAKFNWGAQILPDLKDTVRVLLIATGVESPQIFGKGGVSAKKMKEMEEELGIEFLGGYI